MFRNNKANIENAIRDILIPLANQHLNQLTLQDLLNLIINGIGDNGNEGPHIDDETGELVCPGAAEPSTTEISSTASNSETTLENDTDETTLENDPTNDDDNTTSSDASTSDNEEFESTTNIIDPEDDTNSSHFLFNKFQVMILTVASTVCITIF